MHRTLIAAGGVLSASTMLLVDSAVKGAALLALAAMAAAILKRDSASTRHLVWLLAIIATLAVPVLSAMLPQWRALPAWASVPRAVEDVASAPSPIRRPAVGAFEATIKVEPVEVDSPSRSARQPAVAPSGASSGLTPPQTAAESAIWSGNWINALPLAWAIGFCLVLLRLMAARWILWNTERQGTVLCSSTSPAEATGDPIVATLESARLQLGVRRPVTLIIHPDETIPVVWGILRHRLLLPAAARQWSGEQLRSVLLHELAHVKRRDTIAQLLAQLACALHWFNPLVWVAAWRLHVERERACDDLVLAQGVRASAYGEHLLNVATRLAPALRTSACGLAMARKSSLEDRLRAVLSQTLNRRRVPATIGAIGLILGACVAVPVAMLRAAGDDPAAPAATPAEDEASVATEMKPKHEDAQRLFKVWQANARSNGNIPGALIGRLGEKVKYFISLNRKDESGRELALRFESLLPRFDASRDWTQADALALLDSVSAIHSIPLLTTLDAAQEATILTGEPLPADLADAPWGKPAANGLRVAWLLEPRAEEYPLGASLNSRILVHNSGEEAAIFVMPSWQQSDSHAAHDAEGAAINVNSTSWTTQARKLTYRLAPGEYCQASAAGIGVGVGAGEEDWANARVGSWIEANAGDVVRFSPGEIEVRYSPSVVGTMIFEGRPLNVDPKDAADLWRTIIAERIERETPIPTGAADREQLLRRLVRDLYGKEPTADEIAAFVADKSPAATHPIASRDLLGIRVQHLRNISPFTGTLPPGDIQFRVLAADPDAARRPRVATGPGYYNLGDNQRLHVERASSGDQSANRATIRFFSSNPKADPPAPSYEFSLPEGRLTYAIAWLRGDGVLWVSQRGLVRRYDFTDPAQVQETRFEQGGLANVPEQLRDALRAPLEAPGEPAPRKDSPKPRDGAKLNPATEERLSWGEPENGLRAAIVRPQALGLPDPDEVMDLRLVAQNVSNAPLRLCNTAAASGLRRLKIRIKGELVQALTSKEPTDEDLLLQPREIAVMRFLPKVAAGRSIAADEDLSFSAEMTIEQAPAGAWTGKLATAEMTTGLTAYGLAPKHDAARALFNVWNAGARWDGAIPGALIGLLADNVKTFARNNPTWKTTPQLLQVLPRLDATRDWNGLDAMALLEDVAAVQDTPIKMALESEVERAIHSGTPLPPELANAPWGEPQPNGLRMAWLLEPLAAAHRLGTPLKSRILFHNAGQESVVFQTRAWHPSAAHQARDANGADINIWSTRWTTSGRLMPFRLAPGEYVEVVGAGIGIGGNKDNEDWQGTRVGSWIEAEAGDDVTFTPAPTPLNDWNEAPTNDGEPRWWPDFVKARLARERPLPADAEVRKRLVYRVAMDLFGTPANEAYAANFLADQEANALDSLAVRLANHPGLTAYAGSLQSGPTRFRVLPADPDAATRPRAASNPGRYTLSDHARLVVTRRLVDKRIVNEARIQFFSPDSTKPAPAEPHTIKLPDGEHSWSAAWVRGGTVLWMRQKGGIRAYDFTNPADVKETEILEPANPDDVPQLILEALRAELDAIELPKPASTAPNTPAAPATLK